MNTNNEKNSSATNRIKVMSFIIACCLIALIPLWNAPCVDYSEWSSYGRKETSTSLSGAVYEYYRGGYVGKTTSMSELMTNKNYNHAAGDSMTGIAMCLYVVAAITCLVVVFSEFPIARRKILYIPAAVGVCNSIWYIYHFSEVVAQNPNTSIAMPGAITILLSVVIVIMCFVSISSKEYLDIEENKMVKELLKSGVISEAEYNAAIANGESTESQIEMLQDLRDKGKISNDEYYDILNRIYK